MNAFSALDRVRVVMSHTTHPGNIGACARAMKVMGLSRLYLVNPKYFPHDDAVAMLLAHGNPNIDLVAVTTVHGNQTIEKVTRNALAVATIAGITGVPFAAGAHRPLVRVAEVAESIHGDSGMDGPAETRNE